MLGVENHKNKLLPAVVSLLISMLCFTIYIGIYITQQQSLMVSNVERSHTYLLALELEMVGAAGVLSQIVDTGCTATTLDQLRTLEYQLQYFSDIARLEGDVKIICSSTLGEQQQTMLDIEKQLPLPLDDMMQKAVLYTTAATHIDPDTPGLFIRYGDFLLTINQRLLNVDTESGTQVTLVTETSEGYEPLFERRIAASYSEIGRYADGALSIVSCESITGLCLLGSHEVQDLGETLLVAIIMSLGLGIGLGTALTLTYRKAMYARMSLRVKLLKAISNKELTVVYQPIVNICDGHLVCAEALVRWIDSDGQFISPDIFCTIAERAGFSDKITDYVISYTIENLWSKPELRDLPVAFNISPNEVLNEDFVSHYTKFFADAGIALSRAKFEITERLQVDLEDFGKAMERIAGAGFRVSLDDFGTGHSSFPYLNKLPIETIKLDRSFVNAVDEESAYGRMLPHILDMLLALDREIVVEGVETETQREWFAARGEILAQGYLFSRPLAPDAFLEFARTAAPDADDRVVHLKFGQ